MPRSATIMGGRPPAGPVTKWLIGATLGITLLLRLTEARTGIGIGDFVFIADNVLAGQVWRLVTYVFVEPSAMNLIVSLLFLYLFGGSFERQWGSRSYLRFVGLSSIGAVLIAIPLTLLVNFALPFNDAGVATGPGPALTALLVSLAVVSPDTNIMLGFVLPIRVRTLVLLMLAYQVLVGLMQEVSTISTTLGAMAMGYVLTTGTWRPERLLANLKLWRLRRKRRGLYVVPPRNRDQTLH
jgi:membrane associated rhomboid family serine protease